ncbi:hypothetical protein J7U46_04235 [Pelomonas sp. V22]|uniref:hypothetical protein n=1 Tax=Pelomonas sp. V22 TaxID=2822139 RepID=UPI0024A9B495|nr:hypothetical protein [Pelomonas sp. V22]MDI4632248.1 hypothetical protein [Pelomonas sp. V22]
MSGPLLLAIVVALIGLASAGLYLRSRQWVKAALVLLAAAGLALLVADPTVPGERAQASARAPASEPSIQLDFPRQLALGRTFSLTLKRSQPLASWRLQLLDENGSLLAQTSASGAEASVSWLPPVAEAMVLQARVLDAAGKPLEQGPVPLDVRESVPLQVQGRFGAPSFDAQALNQLLLTSNANLDWQLTLGKTVTRAETPRSTMAVPELIVIDAAHFESLATSARQALLAQVGQGVPLVVLAGNARDAGVWSRELLLPLSPQEPAVLQPLPGLELSTVALRPSSNARSAWSANASDKPWLWHRPWQRGRIVWLGLSDWHRHAINAPQLLGSWWQTVLDQAGLRQQREAQWVFPDAMPLVGDRAVVCLRGGAGELTAEVPADKVRLQLQRRADRADDACAALWPRAAGWMVIAPADGKLASARMYVFSQDAWPQWQRGIKREGAEALAAAAALAAAHSTAAAVPVPAWLFALLFGLGALALWWRERR